MSSLWTPEGEHRITPEQPGEPPPPERAADASRPVGAPDPSDAGLNDLEAELVSAPVDAIIANHCFGLFQLAALHLSQSPPNFEAARLAIDALGALVEGLNGRLGEATETLTGALAQVRLAYVELSGRAQPGASSPDGPAPPSETPPG